MIWMTGFLKDFWKGAKEYLKDSIDDLKDLADDFRDHLFKNPFKKSSKIHRKVQKKVGKRGRPALILAERIRGVIHLIVGFSIIYATIIAYTEGVVGIQEMVHHLIHSWVGRILIFFIGTAYLIYGAWKIIMGCD